MMKAMTLYEPWATMMAIGAKKNETRGQRTAHRGEIAIHAGLNKSGCSDKATAATLEAFKRRGIEPTFSFGYIVAVLEIFAVLSVERTFVEEYFDEAERENLIKNGQVGLNDEEWQFGNYDEGRFFYRTRNVRRLKTPIKAKGMQCIGWTVPPDIEAKVREQL